MALNDDGRMEEAGDGRTGSGEDLIDLFARLVASSQPAGKSRRRARQEAKGLPGPETLKDLAQAYLEQQRGHWPELAKRGLLPKPTPQVVERLAAEFEARFRDGEPATIGRLLADPPWQEVGAAYLRFSDDNSNPRSLVQQLRNVLNRTAADWVFVPWAYIIVRPLFSPGRSVMPRRVCRRRRGAVERERPSRLSRQDGCRSFIS